MASKKLTFRVFKIESEKLSKTGLDLIKELRDRMVNSDIESRIISIREGSDDNEVLSFSKYVCTPGSEYFYGVIMRLKPAKELQALPDNFLKMNSLNEDELLELKEIEGKVICSSLYHFFIKGNILITDLQQINPISCFSNYLNKLLLGSSYIFYPYIVAENLKLKDESTLKSG